jgi:Ca2+-binding RTX toxin-like protein
MTHIDATYYDTAGTNYLKINHTSPYNPGSAWSDYALYGLEGNDTLIGGHGDDDLFGGTGNDLLRGGYGYNLLNGGAGTDTADYSTYGMNTTYYTPWGVNINLGFGEAYAIDAGQVLDDILESIENANGSNLADVITGSSIANVLNGNGGNDVLNGGAGNDIVTGGAGHDVLKGGIGIDVLNGGSGDDDLIGGAGRDTLTGGTGYDAFVFTSLSDSTNVARDVITDFQTGVDLIDVSAFDVFEFIGTDSFAAHGFDYGLLRYSFSGGNTIVQLDDNGGGTADLVITLQGTHVLHASDFIF